MKYSIAIVTYEDRFDRWFKPLLSKIKAMKPEVEVIVQVNANYPSGMSESYRKNMLHLVAQYDNVFPFFWTEFRALAKLWNNCILNASNNHVLVLNDDLDIRSPLFFRDLEAGIQRFPGRTFKINTSWSHFLANREEIDRLHWFDETILGVGNEDGDMALRIEQEIGPLPDVKCNHSFNGVDYTNPLPGIKKVHGKYSAFSRERFESKLDLSPLTEEEKKDSWSHRHKMGKIKPIPNQYPSEKFWWDNKHKLKE